MGDLIGFIPSVHHPQLINCCIPSSQIASPPITENYNFWLQFWLQNISGRGFATLHIHFYIHTYFIYEISCRLHYLLQFLLTYLHTTEEGKPKGGK